jgi:multidrug efflux pump subunit AcrB
VIRTGIIIVLTGLILVAAVVFILLVWRTNPNEPPSVTIETASAGLPASEVEQTIAAPIEQQVRGVEHLRRLHSRSWHDGSCTLEVSFAPGIDVNLALGLVQNRVALAIPALPVEAQNMGVTVRKGSSGPFMIVCVRSPDARFDALYLGRYAATELKDQLARVYGISDVTVVGAREYALRIYLDPEKLKAREVTAADVTKALKEQNVDLNAGLAENPGGVFALTSPVRGGQLQAEKIESIVVKVDPQGRMVRLRDIARVELGATRGTSASLDGNDVLALVVYALAQAEPSDVQAAVRTKQAEVRRGLPDGVELFAEFDFSQEAMADGRGYLVLDVDLPVEASAELTRRALTDGERVLRQLAGVRNVLALSEQPFDRDRNQPCLIVALGPAQGTPIDRAQLMREIRAGFIDPEKRASIRMRDLSGRARTGRFGYAIDFAIIGPDRPRLQELAGQLVAQMSQDRRLTDVRAGLRLEPVLSVDVDRAKAKSLDLDPAEILRSLEAFLGYAQAGNTTHSGGTWRFRLPVDAGGPANLDTLNQLKVRTRQGQMAALHTVAALRQLNEPITLDRIDLNPAISITANPAEGSTLAEARTVCERLAAEILPKQQPADYRLIWK